MGVGAALQQGDGGGTAEEGWEGQPGPGKRMGSFRPSYPYSVRWAHREPMSTVRAMPA